jgi:hypothetical protein
MKTCNGCKYADWARTKSGRLHPSGSGWCRYEYKVPELPASMYFMSTPSPCGGHIERKKVFKDDCPYWCPIEAKKK